MQKDALNKVIKSTKRVIEHHNEVSKLKGENFNVFSILNMESKENGTHSAFLGELLNPEGSHEKGNVFLRLFLEAINNTTIQADTAELVLEKHIDKRDNENKTGGRIDIFISDKSGNYVSIENKIYAIDQNLQLKRYHNYKKGSNKVYYLTLYGEDASKKSKGDLKEGIDYFCISYSNTIIKWLDSCYKEAAEQPILRETIKQYSILIKKLTNTLNTQQEQELADVILNNLSESEYIANNYNKVLNTIRDNFRNAIATSLSTKLDKSRYEVLIGDAIHKNYAQLWIDIKGEKEAQLRFGIETFSGKSISHGDMFIGILDKHGKGSQFPSLSHFERLSEWWPHFKYLENKEEQTFSMSNQSILKAIQHVNSDTFNAFVALISNQIEAFVKENEEHVFKYINQ
ncbi:hypothetical protein A9Q87_13375 [Flavobacteriales bacterium 34_180_T64]|nr:hypothetical protein A9Q87_13375 [Flavobacteriales bacterium 34_180_T64]